MRTGCFVLLKWTLILAWVSCISPAWGQAQPSLKAERVSGRIQIRITGPANSSWTVLFATNLAPAATWFPLSTLTLSGTTATVIDTTGLPGPQFYRAVSSYEPAGIVTTGMKWIGPGSFSMGSPLSEKDRFTDETPHPVTITTGFYLGLHPVTQGEFQDVMGYNPAYFNGLRGVTDYGIDLNRPVEQVYWHAAATYCSELTLRERQAGRIPSNWAYRLPSEAEWEFACRAGTVTAFSYGDDPNYTTLPNYAWFIINSISQTHAVSQKLPNPWGLFDMHGNTFEWCQDIYGPHPSAWAIDPQGATSGFNRVFRGGGWSAVGKFCRSAARFSAEPVTPYNYIGFRVVLAPEN